MAFKNQLAKMILLKLSKNLLPKRFCSYKSIKRPAIGLTRKRTAPQRDENQKDNAPNLAKQISARIRTTGPITVADYMKEVLTNPYAGYYMHHDVFGKEGDFITSPEISQIFGELVAVWLVMEWRKIGSPTPLQIVELGPGRGTLARDILKVITQLERKLTFSLHLVEISPYLSGLQASRLCYRNELLPEGDAATYYRRGETASGMQVYWHKHFDDVPQGFSIVLAHEFFDALPVHKLQQDAAGLWKEVLIDLANEGKDANETAEAPAFRYVLSKAQTPISRYFQPHAQEKRNCLEYAVETERLLQKLTERLEMFGGFALIMDYGHLGDKTDTFRAFKKHKLHDPLLEPGTADLTADVDFAHMRRVCEQSGQVVCFGPVEQRTFLAQMQGEARLELLCQNALPEKQQLLRSGYEMLTDPQQMGSRFKFFSMFPAVLKDHLNKFGVYGFQC